MQASRDTLCCCGNCCAFSFVMISEEKIDLLPMQDSRRTPDGCLLVGIDGDRHVAYSAG